MSLNLCNWSQPKIATPALALSGLHTSGNALLDYRGELVRICAVNWCGLETRSFAPHGLELRSCKEMMLQISDLGFNTIRLPFSDELLATASTPASIDPSINPEFIGCGGIGIIDQVVDLAGQTGLGIILDHHRSDAGCGPNNNGLWYTADHSEAAWIRNWEMLAARYLDNPTVLGADLHNEPHGPATWGSGDPATDWRLAAERAGNAILAINPNWLIFVEGIEAASSGHYWWGGNLSHAGRFPVRLDVPGRLVYSPHDYPASVYQQPWFDGPKYPQTMNALWERNWGYLFRNNIAPVFLGEFGSKLQTRSDRQWLSQLIAYLNGYSHPARVRANATMSWAWWSWNPDSHDTGGILSDDWVAVDTVKLNALAPAMLRKPMNAEAGVGIAP